MKLKVTNTKTGKVFEQENTNHAWNELCKDMCKTHPNNLICCDIECLLTGGKIWYLLDECGNWEYLPAHYTVEEVK